MELEIGIACGHCDVYNPMSAVACSACGHDLSLAPRGARHPGTPLNAAAGAEVGSPAAGGGAHAAPSDAIGGPSRDTIIVAYGPGAATEAEPEEPPAGAAPVDDSAPQTALSGTEPTARQIIAESPSESPYAGLSQEEFMEQARHYVCKMCSTPVPQGHKFCGRCGEVVPPEILTARTMFFSEMQNPSKAKLILIRGEGMDGLSFHLKAEQHIVGRNGQLVFPDDPFISPKHANFFYRDGHLVVRDEGSLNGVYIRVRGTVPLTPGDMFLAGEQLFRHDVTPRASDGPEQDGTYFYSSPKHTSPFRETQLLQGGMPGMVVCARASALQIGREGGDLNFPGDLYMSGSHCRIEDVGGGKFTLTDLNSRNGTYLRLKTERDLNHGDYLFIGRKLLRVELNSN